MRDTSQDKRRLREAGYTVMVHSKFHWQVKKPGNHQTLVDIWPTARKFLIHFTPGPAPVYKDVIEAVDSCFRSYDYEEYEDVTLEQQAAIDEVMLLRVGGLEYINAKYGLRKD